MPCKTKLVTSLLMEPDLKDEYWKIAREEDRPLSWVCVRALKEWIKDRKEKGEEDPLEGVL